MRTRLCRGLGLVWVLGGMRDLGLVRVLQRVSWRMGMIRMGRIRMTSSLGLGLRMPMGLCLGWVGIQEWDSQEADLPDRMV